LGKLYVTKKRPRDETVSKSPQDVGLVRPAAIEKEKDEKFFHSGRWKVSENATHCGGARAFALSTMMMGEMSQGQREMQSLVRAANATARAQGSMEPVTLVANDGTEIIIDRRAAMVSGTIKSMLAGPGARTISAPMLLPREARRLAHSTSDIARGACVPHLHRSPAPARACSRVL